MSSLSNKGSSDEIVKIKQSKINFTFYSRLWNKYFVFCTLITFNLFSRIIKLKHNSRSFLQRHKVRQLISVMKTNTGIFGVFKTKSELKWQFVFITEILWRIVWRNKWESLFDVVKNLC